MREIPTPRPGFPGAPVGLLGDSWTLMIVWASCGGVTRFDDYQRALGVARNILSNRLRRLVALGILEKHPVREGALRQEYRLTAKGRELRDPLSAIHQWATRWSAPHEPAPA